MSIGGGASASKSRQTSRSNSQGSSFGRTQSNSFIDPFQQPFLDQLRTMSFDRVQQQRAPTRMLTDDLTTGNLDALQTLGGLANPNQVIQSQLTGLQSGLTDIYNQGVDRIGDNAINAGAFGGSRQGVAESVLGGEIGKAFTQGYGDIVANASRQAIDAANSRLAGGRTALQTSLLGDYGDLELLSGILGGPTVLNQSSGVTGSQNMSEGFSQGKSDENSAKFGFSAK